MKIGKRVCWPFCHLWSGWDKHGRHIDRKSKELKTYVGMYELYAERSCLNCGETQQKVLELKAEVIR